MTRVGSQRHRKKKECSIAAAKKRRRGQSSGAGPGALAAAGHIVLLCLEQMYRNAKPLCHIRGTMSSSASNALSLSYVNCGIVLIRTEVYFLYDIRYQ